MVSVSGAGLSTAPMSVDWEGGDNYLVRGSGGGQVDQKMNEAAVNQLLAAYGLKVVNGEFQSVDGFTLGSTNTSATTGFGDAPAMPAAFPAALDSSTLNGRASWVSSMQNMDAGALMWVALSTMAQTSMRDITDAKDLKHALQKGKLAAKDNQIKATETQIAHEREEAGRQLVVAVVVAIVSAIGAGVGGGGGAANAAAGAAITGAANIYQAQSNYESKTNGPQSKADREKIRAMVAEKEQEMLQMGIDDAGSNYEEARELLKLAMKILTEHSERETQVVQALTRG